MNRCSDIRYDAAGHPCYKVDRVKAYGPTLRGRELFSRFLLCHLLIFPRIEIRVQILHPETIKIIKGGVSPETCEYKEITGRSISALRRLYCQHGRGVWKIHRGVGYIAFVKEPVVLRDPLRRWF